MSSEHPAEEVLRRVLQRVKMIPADSTLAGPDLIAAAESYIGRKPSDRLAATRALLLQLDLTCVPKVSHWRFVDPEKPEGPHRLDHGFSIYSIESRIRFTNQLLKHIAPGLSVEGNLLAAFGGFRPALEALHATGHLWLEDDLVYLTRKGDAFLRAWPNVREGD